MTQGYLEKLYAGFLGMNIGIRLGAPVEPTIWTYERIQKTYGDICSYVKDYKNFAADDDANGPVFFIRALLDKDKDREMTAQDVADAWLNYAREGIGMFWWGGYGISTEHTAYLNLKHGIPAPQSGSIEQNGKTLAEQIGGQIFIDTWGLIHPGNPEKAARYGELAASVSHDGEGLNGARFFCAAIAKAFETADIEEIIRTGLSFVPQQSLYHQVADAVRAFYESHPNQEQWRECYQMLAENWGYDRYPGVCHIIPNAGVCFMAMLYGKGQFDRTVEIATMAGWDTDCNAGNCGTVLGVACGLAGIPERYRQPINDGIVCSGISGYLNILDIPSFCRELAIMGYKQAGEPVPEELAGSIKNGELHFDFELPGSTHAFRVSDPFFCRLFPSRERSLTGNGSLKILIDRMSRGDQCRIFYKPFYLREDFSDERYSPAFSPTVYPGQQVSMALYLEQWNGWETPGIAPYVRTMSGRMLLEGYRKLKDGEWMEVSFTIPDTDGEAVSEVGFVLEGYSIQKAKTLGLLYLDHFCVDGKSKYTIDMAKQKKSFAAVTPFTMNHGAWEAEDGALSLMSCEESFAYTGNYYARDCRIEATVVPRHGSSHLLLARAQGALRSYAFGFEENRAVILLNNKGWKTIKETEFSWEIDREYRMRVDCIGTHMGLFIDGKCVLEAEDGTLAYGMFGCGSRGMGRTSFKGFSFCDL